MRKTLALAWVITILLVLSILASSFASIGREEINEDDEDEYTLNIQTAITDNIYPPEESIDPGRAGRTYPEPGNYNFSKDVEISVEAISEEGWRFTHWSGDVPEEKQKNREITISIDCDKNLTANFSTLEEDEYVSSEKDSYEPGEQIIIEVKNDGSAGGYPILAALGIHIVRVETEEVVYQPDIEYTVPAVPDYGRTELLVWNQTDPEGEQVPEGDYTVKAESDRFNYTTEFTISSEEDDEVTPGFTMFSLTLAVIVSGLAYRKKSKR